MPHMIDSGVRSIFRNVPEHEGDEVLPWKKKPTESCEDLWSSHESTDAVHPYIQLDLHKPLATIGFGDNCCKLRGTFVLFRTHRNLWVFYLSQSLPVCTWLPGKLKRLQNSDKRCSKTHARYFRTFSYYDLGYRIWNSTHRGIPDSITAYCCHCGAIAEYYHR